MNRRNKRFTEPTNAKYDHLILEKTTLGTGQTAYRNFFGEANSSLRLLLGELMKLRCTELFLCRKKRKLHLIRRVKVELTP